MPSFGEVAGAVVLLSAVGTGIGVWSELSGNDDAKNELITVNTCMGSYAGEVAISKDLETCLQDGVPGGKGLGDDDNFKELKAGKPTQYLVSARERLVDDQDFNINTSIEWALGLPIVIGGLAICCGGCDD